MSTTINDSILTKLKSLNSDKSASSSISADLDLQTTDWLSLLVAQIKNQDMYNTADTSETTSQLAQYSMIQAINDLVDISEDAYATDYTSYATSLMGKEVTVARLDEDDELVTETGTVTGVTLYEDEPMVYIGDTGYTLSEIMIVGTVKESSTDPDTDDTSDDTDTSTDATDASE